MKAIDRTGVDYYCQVSDVNLIRSIVNLLPNNPLCINIGAAYGTSALAMLEARPDSMVVSIDIEDCPEEFQLMKENGFIDNKRYRFIQGRSQDIGNKWKKNMADFVFIDGSHTYEDCTEDAVVWYKVLKQNGVMAFHDYESKIRILESVKRAVDDIVPVLRLRQVAREGTMIVFVKHNYEDIYFAR